MKHNVKLERNLQILRYRFSDMATGEIRKVDGKVVWGYAKLAKKFELDKATVITICQRRAHWLEELKKLSKQYLPTYV